MHLVHRDTLYYRTIGITDVAEAVNHYLERMGEKWRLEARKVGAVLTSFGFTNRTRTNSGYVIQLTQEDSVRLHQLVASYGIDGYQDEFLRVPPKMCGLCSDAGFKKKATRFQPEKPSAR